MFVSAESEAGQWMGRFGEAFRVSNGAQPPEILIICEHASGDIPSELGDLGLSETARNSHIAWDPGALEVATELRDMLRSVLVEGTISRLVYDCNRPPVAPSAIPIRSELYDIPGNFGLDPQSRERRIRTVYDPFTRAVADQIAEHSNTLRLLVTVHSFSPVFFGKPRLVEIGILHGCDSDFAHAMMETLPETPPFVTRMNEPYGAKDGVTHTIDHHGAGNGLPNVMIEIRSDLIKSQKQQKDMAKHLSGWIEAARRLTPDQEARR